MVASGQNWMLEETCGFFKLQDSNDLSKEILSASWGVNAWVPVSRSYFTLGLFESIWAHVYV